MTRSEFLASVTDRAHRHEQRARAAKAIPDGVYAQMTPALWQDFRHLKAGVAAVKAAQGRCLLAELAELERTPEQALMIELQKLERTMTK